MTKINLTVAELNERTANSCLEIAQVKAEGREENIRRAIAAYENALLFFTRNTHPLRNARIRNSLGIAYDLLADVRDKETNLNLAIPAYREALRVRTFDAFPQDYAMTENNLAVAY